MASCSDDQKMATVATAHSPPTRVCLIRHGETESNASGRLQGQLDVPLNARGRDQALLAATALAEQIGDDAHSIAAIYTSDLSRARETCDCIARALATASVVSTSALRERHLGALQGIVRSEAAALHPAAWRALVSRDPHHELGGGESIAQFGKRVGDALDLIRGAHTGRAVLVVCHGGVIDVVHRIVTRTPMDARRTVSVPNASLS